MIDSTELLVRVRIPMSRTNRMFIKLSTIQGLQLRFCSSAWYVVALEGCHDPKSVSICYQVVLIESLYFFICDLYYLSIRVLHF